MESSMISTLPTKIRWVAVAALAFSFCQGCLVLPVRAPTKTSGASGETAKVQMNFIEAGKTTREEVLRKLGGTESAIEGDTYFVGRWTSSSWGVLWMVTGNNTADGGWNRHWETRNVLVEFDEMGLVKEYRVFPDSQLLKEFSALVAKGPKRPLDLSKPMEIPVEHFSLRREINSSGTIILENDSFEFREADGAGKHSFKISPNQIRDFSLAPMAEGNHPDPHYVKQSIHFSGKTRVGSRITLSVDVPTVLLLVKYLAQTRSGE
jgi:hypothetical protein